MELGVLHAVERPAGVVNLAQSRDLMRMVPRVPGEHVGAKLRLARPEWMGVHNAARAELDDELPACSEHSGTRPACLFRVLVWEAAADSAAADVDVLMAVPLAPVQAHCPPFWRLQLRRNLSSAARDLALAGQAVGLLVVGFDLMLVAKYGLMVFLRYSAYLGCYGYHVHGP